MRLSLLSLALIFSVLPLAAQEEAPPPVGAVVTRIAIVPQPAGSSLFGLLELREGEPFSPEALRSSLKNIFRLGIYSDVRALWEPAEGGIALTIELVETPLVEKITVRGNGPLGRQRIIKAARLDRDLRFAPGREGRILEQIRMLYRESGYWAADVRLFSRVNLESGGIRLEIAIDPGSQTVLRSMRIDGFPALSEREIISAFGDLRIGGPFREKLFDAERKRLQEIYLERDFLTVDIIAGEPIYDDEENAVDLELTINAGPQIDLAVRTSSSGKRLWADLIPFQDRNVPLDQIVENGRRRILQQLKSEGHLEAEVKAEWQIDPETGRFEVTLFIAEGPRFRVGRLRLEGIGKRLSKTILPRLSLSSKGWFSSAAFSEQAVDDDVQRVMRMLRDEGFFEARLLRWEPRMRQEAKAVDILLAFDPGPRARAGTIVFRGNSTYSAEKLRAVAGLKEGVPITSVLLENSLQRLRDFYDGEGFAEAGISVSTSGEGEDLELAFDILERERSAVKKIIVAGNEITSEGVIRRALTFREGDPFSRRSISESQRALYRLGIFERVVISGVDEELSQRERRVVVRVDETLPYSVHYGLGLDSEEKFRFVFGVSNSNVAGRNTEISFSTTVSALRQRYLLSFRTPRLFRGLVDNFVRLFYEEIERQDFSTRSKGLLLESTGFRWRGWEITGRYQFKLVDLFDARPGKFISRFHRDVRLSLLSSILTADGRDDLLDPHSGYLANLILQYSPRWLGSEAGYVKGRFQFSSYHEVLPAVVMAVGCKIGLAAPFSDARGIPLSEQFYFNGIKTLRGFDLSEEEPVTGGEEERFPVEGDALLIGNLEFRFPLRGSVGGVVFYDAGGAFPRIGEISLRDLIHAAGIGLRYGTPIGPLRVDYAWRLDSSDRALIFSFGHAF